MQKETESYFIPLNIFTLMSEDVKREVQTATETTPQIYVPKEYVKFVGIKAGEKYRWLMKTDTERGRIVCLVKVSEKEAGV